MLRLLSRFRRMRVGVYVDAFNVYYGARDLCTRNTSGWRWLDIAALAESQIATRGEWIHPVVTRIVYCTALRDKDNDPTSAQDQKTYIGAISHDPRVHVEYGQYNPKYGRGVLTKPDSRGRRRTYERLISPGQNDFPPGMPFGEVRGADGNMHISIHYASYEEKGSDVNLASHLLVDILSDKIDAAVVLSNDGDLRLPLSIARAQVPTGLINPGSRPTSQMLKGAMRDGVGNHWWHRLQAADFRNHQLPSVIGENTKPSGW